MKRTILLLGILLVTPLAKPFANAVDVSAQRSAYVLQGCLTDAEAKPLADVRVGLRSTALVTQTDATGHFTLSFSPPLPLVPDKDKAYAALELDKEGYLGRTVLFKDLITFEQPVNEKLEPNPLTEDRAEYSRRMSMDYTFPLNTPGVKFSSNSPDISAGEWERFFSTMDARKKDGATERVNFQAYIPKGASKLKAMFLLTRHGIGSVDHPKLREFADRNAIALVGLLGNPVQRGFYPVSVIDEDIQRLGDLLHHPELSKLPLISFGHSNGTGFAGIFPSQRPDRVIAWVSYHSGTAFHLQFPGVEKVPGLALHGNLDPFLKNGQEETIKNLRKNRNAAVAMMLEGNVEHAPVDKGQSATWDFIFAFCEAAMRTRLNSDGTLKPVVIEDGWLGANYDRAQGGQQDLAIAPYTEVKGDKSVANWLPDQKFAEVWKTYGKTDPRPSAK